MLIPGICTGLLYEARGGICRFFQLTVCWEKNLICHPLCDRHCASGQASAFSFLGSQPHTHPAFSAVKCGSIVNSSQQTMSRRDVHHFQACSSLSPNQENNPLVMILKDLQKSRKMEKPAYLDDYVEPSPSSPTLDCDANKSLSFVWVKSLR
jgi:hypothetical protein